MRLANRGSSANRETRLGPPRDAWGTFDDLYRRDEIEAVLRQLLPRELRGRRLRQLACNGFLTERHLDRIRATIGDYLLAAAGGSHDAVLVDLGCGIGGLGRWLSRALGTELIGIDLSSVAIERARQSVRCGAHARRRRFEVADFRTTGLPSGSAAAVISWDALYLTDDPSGALGEVRRILRPRGGMLFTAYLSRHRYPGTPDLVRDWRSLLAANGFAVERQLVRSAEWRRIMRKKHEARWARREWLRRRLGTRAEPELAVSAAMLGLGGRPSFLDHVERVEISARRI